MALWLDEVPGAFGARAILFDLGDFCVVVVGKDCRDFGVPLLLVPWLWDFYERLLAVTLHESFDLFIEMAIWPLRLRSGIPLLGASDWASWFWSTSMTLARCRTSLAAFDADSIDIMPICGHRLALSWCLLRFTCISRSAWWFCFDCGLHGRLCFFFLDLSLFIYRHHSVLSSRLRWSLTDRHLRWIIEGCQLLANRTFKVDMASNRSLTQATCCAHIIFLRQTCGQDIQDLLTALAHQLLRNHWPRGGAACSMIGLPCTLSRILVSKRRLMIDIPKAGIALRIRILFQIDIY